MSRRPYTQRRRAAQQQRTRQRIVEATMALHQERGPRDTTIRAVAERAGVQRLTVYRHFPDEGSLFAACTGTWLEQNPPPTATAWAHASEPMARVGLAVEAFAAYYQRTAAMWRRAYRDVEEVAALQPPMKAFEAHIDGIRDELARALPGSAALASARRATVGVALRFPTWERLQREGITPDGAGELAVAWLRGLGVDRGGPAE